MKTKNIDLIFHLEDRPDDDEDFLENQDIENIARAVVKTIEESFDGIKTISYEYLTPKQTKG